MRPNQVPEMLKPILEKEENDFQERITSLKKQALEEKLAIEECEPQKLLEMRRANFPFYFELLSNTCFCLALFSGMAVTDKLTKLGVSAKVLKWFVDLEDIEEQFALLSSKDIIVLKNHALQLIHIHLHSKIQAQMLNDYHLIIGEAENKKEEILRELRKIFRRREYGKTRLSRFKGDFDLEMNGQIAKIENVVKSQKKAKKFFFNSFDGKTEKFYLRELMDCFIRPEGMSGSQFAAAIYGLMTLLLKDENKEIMSKDEFWDQEDALYGNNYNRYLASRYKKIVGLTESGIFSD
jgi:hypothetical protein